MATQYANLLSRLLLRKGFTYQFAFPILDNRPVTVWMERLEWCLPRPKHAAPPVAPIFIVGLPRTGSTWLQTLLCTHPDLAYITHFTHNFTTCFRAASLVRRVLGLDARAERFIGDSVVNGLRSPSEGTAYWAEWFGMDPACLYYDPLTRNDLDAATVDAIMATLGGVTALFGTGKRFFCKNPSFIPYTPVLAGLFPDGRFIHLVRDPRPTANSMRKLLHACRKQLAFIRASGQPLALRLDDFIPYPRLPRLAEYVARFGADDIRTTARLWRDATLFMEDVAPTVPNLLTVRFESVLADPAGAVAAILDFCRLPPLDLETPAFRDMFAQTGKVAHTNAYTDYAAISTLCRETMPCLGYDPDGPVGALLPAGSPAFGRLL
jgi:hypothetical protein